MAHRPKLHQTKASAPLHHAITAAIERPNATDDAQQKHRVTECKGTRTKHTGLGSTHDCAATLGLYADPIGSATDITPVKRPPCEARTTAQCSLTQLTGPEAPRLQAPSTLHSTGTRGADERPHAGPRHCTPEPRTQPTDLQGLPRGSLSIAAGRIPAWTTGAVPTRAPDCLSRTPSPGRIPARTAVTARGGHRPTRRHKASPSQAPALPTLSQP